mmetsp:Transcript_12205/g.31939  ORF Transcript_12205/g.31939 Transcript_12205/m.31939 type:complete len:380 (-) Transcript_12205:171-1310(-)
MVDAFHEANALFVDGEYDSALREYTRALDAEPDNAEYYAKRAVAHTELGNYIDAVADATKSIKLAPTLKAFLRKGEALFRLEEYDEAELAFRKGLDLVPDSIILRRWLRKCQAERSPAIVAKPRPMAVQPASSAVPPSAPATPAALSAPGGPAMSAPKPVPPSDPSRVRHEWYQTLTHVVVSVLIRGCAEGDVSVAYDHAALDIAIKLPGSHSEYQLSLSLFGKIDTEACKHTVGPTKVEVRMKKVEATKWDSLEGSGDGGLKAFQPPPPAAPAAGSTSTEASARPAYPTSRQKKVDWNSLENEVKRNEDEEKLEGDEALQKLFRDIYARSDEDTRRAMNKSFQTSGGTVLSTNWGEVKEKNYEEERSAPTGQEWKKWG